MKPIRPPPSPPNEKARAKLRSRPDCEIVAKSPLELLCLSAPRPSAPCDLRSPRSAVSAAASLSSAFEDLVPGSSCLTALSLLQLSGNYYAPSDVRGPCTRRLRIISAFFSSCTQLYCMLYCMSAVDPQSRRAAEPTGRPAATQGRPAQKKFHKICGADARAAGRPALRKNSGAAGRSVEVINGPFWVSPAKVTRIG